MKKLFSNLTQQHRFSYTQMNSLINDDFKTNEITINETVTDPLASTKIGFEGEFSVKEDQETDLEETKSVNLQPNIRKDLHNIIFLIYLYFLQGISLGLTYSLPFILGSRNVSYSDQGTFSIAFWPFGLKLLWAPIVDSVYVKKFGRRKSWLIPMQYTMGILLYFFSNNAHKILELNESISRKGLI